MKILLTDPRHLLREALALLLRQADDAIEVVEANSLAVAIGALDRRSFDIVLVEGGLVAAGELGGLAGLIARAQGARVVLLCSAASRRILPEALHLGAAGVIVTDLRGAALVSALRLVLAGEVYIPPSLLDDADDDGLDGVALSARPGLARHLTRRELEVVRLLAEGLSNREIAARLGLAEVTVKLHLHNAFEKIGARSRADAVRIALSSGLAPVHPSALS